MVRQTKKKRSTRPVFLKTLPYLFVLFVMALAMGIPNESLGINLLIGLLVLVACVVALLIPLTCYVFFLNTNCYQCHEPLGRESHTWYIDGKDRRLCAKCNEELEDKQREYQEERGSVGVKEEREHRL